MIFRLRASLILTSSILFNFIGGAQEQSTADSIKVILKQKIEEGQRMELLRQLAFHENHPETAKIYAEELISLAKKTSVNRYSFYGYLHRGYKVWLLGDNDAAMKDFIKSLDFAKKDNFSEGESTAYTAIADIYNGDKKHKNALYYYSKALEIIQNTSDSLTLASILLNIGDTYLNLEKHDSALLYLSESTNLFNLLNYKTGVAYGLGNMGMAYANLADIDLAEQNINEAVKILESSKDYYPICFYLISMADIYLERGDVKEAFSYTERSLGLAQEYGLKQQISDANLKLSELYESENNSGRSLKHYKAHVAYRDSVTNLETVQKMADLRTEFEVSLKENEIDALEKDKELQRTYIIIAVALFLLSLAILFYFR